MGKDLASESLDIERMLEELRFDFPEWKIGIAMFCTNSYSLSLNEPDSRHSVILHDPVYGGMFCFECVPREINDLVARVRSFIESRDGDV